MSDVDKADLLLTEVRKAVRLEAGHYVVVVDPKQVNPLYMANLADALERDGIILHVLPAYDVSAVRFVRVESPETIQVEEKS